MQEKTVRKNIETKMKEWLDSIDRNSVKDKTLAKDLKNEILVSGGSIVSLLTNEKVNDYDVYIKSESTLLRLTEHYRKRSTRSDGITILNWSNKDQLLKGYEDGVWKWDENYESQVTIAINNLQPGQVRLLLPSAGGYKNEHKYTDEELLGYMPMFFSPNAISLSNGVQVVLRFTGNHGDIHKSFDFIHATNYFNFEEGLVLNKEALTSIITKQLKYQGSLYPLTSIIRMKKFIKRGWNINAGEILKILFQVSELNLSDVNVLEDQLIGVDVAYFGKLIEILRGQYAKETMTSHYLNTIIDKVFNSYDEEEGGPGQ